MRRNIGNKKALSFPRTAGSEGPAKVSPSHSGACSKSLRCDYSTVYNKFARQANIALHPSTTAREELIRS